MKYNPDIHHRRSIRLKNYDYSRAGMYFVTICVNHRLPLFGQIVAGEMLLNDVGIIVRNTWLDLVNHVSNLALHEFVVMPNHFHGIIEIVGAGSKPAHNTRMFHNGNLCPISTSREYRAGLEPARTEKNAKNLSEIVRQFKTFSARRINESLNVKGTPVWQRNYHEHIIRNEADYLRIANYVEANPLRWQEDYYFS
jgi:REP element-mobilizing transposase RayT